ncbi:MAG: cell division protein FtsZ [Anaerolineales bacterium]|nr:cell division protein FtsZ [Anaerolineales bacterium]
MFNEQVYDQRLRDWEDPPYIPVIKVMGLGGGGSNAVDRMIHFGLTGVEFIIANTDRQAMAFSQASVKLQLGPKLTRGLGAGGDPRVGEQAALESKSDIALALEGADMVFLTAGMGGGTGTGSIPVAAQIAKDMGIATIAVVTKPFAFEVGGRQRNAAEGLLKLQPHVNTLITIPNERLLQTVSEKATLSEAFHLADDVLRQAVQSITELITEPGIINVDFAHIQRLMELGGGALMSIGQASGEEKAVNAVKQALYHPLLEDISLVNASGLIVNFTSGMDLTLSDIGQALNYLQEQIPPDAELIFGATQNERFQGKVQVNLIVTGLGATTFEDVFTSFSREERVIPEPITRKIVKEVVDEEEESPQRFEMGRDPLDVPAFMRRRAYANSPYGE